MFRILFIAMAIFTSTATITQAVEVVSMREFSGHIERINKNKFIVDNRMGDKVSFVKVDETVIKGEKDTWKKLKKGDWVAVSWKFVDKPRKAYIILVGRHVSDLTKGKILYDINCVICHGFTGEGDGPVGAMLTPRPRNFAVGDFKFDTDEDGEPGNDNDLITLIKQGAGVFGGSPLMAPWLSLSDEDVANLIVYIRSLKQE